MAGLGARAARLRIPATWYSMTRTTLGTARRGRSTTTRSRSAPSASGRDRGVKRESRRRLAHGVCPRRWGLHVQPVPEREAEQRPENPFTVVAAPKVVVAQRLHRVRIEETEAAHALGRQRVEQHGTQLVPQPRRGWPDEPPFLCSEVRGGKPGAEGAPQQMLVAP